MANRHNYRHKTDRRFTAEHKAKIAAALKGRRMSDAARAAMSTAKKGKPGRPQTEATRAKMRALSLGRIITPEAREKMRQAKLGKPGPWAGKKRGPLRPEWRAAIAAANRGCVGPWAGKTRGPHSEATKLKIAVGNKGKQFPHIRKVKYGDIWMRSTYEARVAAALDALGIPWQYEPFRFDIGVSRTYLPDFYLPDDDAYWEVKGWFGPKSRDTTARFREHYPEIPLVVVMLPQIKELERAAARLNRNHPAVTAA